MPEEKENEGAGNGAGEGQGEDQNKDTTAKENENGQNNSGGDSGAKPEENGGKGSEGKDNDNEPPTKERKNVVGHIINRQKKTIEKLREKSQGGEGGEGEEGDEIAPEDKELVEKVVGPMIAPFAEKLIGEEDNREIGEFLEKNPDFKPYEAKARKYIAHPSRRHLPIETIFYEIAGPDLIKIGADRKKVADDKAKEANVGGGSSRGGEGQGSVWDLTPEQFAEQQERVRRGEKIS